MKTCSKCNISYDDDKKFCKKCGSPLVAEYNIDPKEAAKKSVYEDRLKTDPLNVEILHEYDQFLFNNLLFKETITVALKLLAISEKDIAAKELAFKSYSKLNLYKDAFEMGEQLLFEKPTDIFLLEELAKLLTDLGFTEKAIVYYDKILTIRSTDYNALYNKALFLLENNQLEKAIEIFKSIYKVDGQNERITSIYVGVDKALNGYFESAIDIFIPVLSPSEISYYNLHNNRGLLYLVYCLSQNKEDGSKIFQWISKIEFDLLIQNYSAKDEQVLAKTLLYLSDYILNDIKSPADSILKTKYFENNFLSLRYFTKSTNDIISEIWYNLGLKQAESNNYGYSLWLLKKACELNPIENKYIEKCSEIKRKLEVESRKKKTKKYIRVFVIPIIVILSLAAFYAYFIC